MSNNNGVTKIRAVLKNEVSMAITIISLTIGVIMFIIVPTFEIKKELALMSQRLEIIETNHLVHIQAGIDNEVQRSIKKDEELEESINDINKKMTEIIVLLKGHID